MANCQLTKRWISFTCLPPCFFTSSPCLQLLLRDHQKGRFKRLKLSRKKLSRRARAVGLLARATRTGRAREPEWAKQICLQACMDIAVGTSSVNAYATITTWLMGAPTLLQRKEDMTSAAVECTNASSAMENMGCSSATTDPGKNLPWSRRWPG